MNVDDTLQGTNPYAQLRSIDSKLEQDPICGIAVSASYSLPLKLSKLINPLLHRKYVSLVKEVNK